MGKSAPGRFHPFPYREEDQRRAEGGVLIPIYRPTVNVTLHNGDKSWTVRALIDTGAPVTVFDRATADALEIDFDKTPRKMSKHKLGGDTYEAQIERVRLTLDPFADLSWETEIDFLVADWGMPFGGLLGTEGFLDRWVVTFHASENYFVVEEPESFNQRLPPDVTEEFERRDTGFPGP